MLSIDDYMKMPHHIEIVEDVEEGGFVARFPELPGCITCADTKEALMENAMDAKKAWLEAAIEDGITIAAPAALSLSAQEGFPDRVSRNPDDNRL